MFKIQR